MTVNAYKKLSNRPLSIFHRYHGSWYISLQLYSENAGTHKSAKTHVGTVFVMRDLYIWP